MEKTIAKELLKIKAVFLRPNEPFTWASGIKSPIYCDNRLTLSYPDTRKKVEDQIEYTSNNVYLRYDSMVMQQPTTEDIIDALKEAMNGKNHIKSKIEKFKKSAFYKQMREFEMEE